MNTENTNKIDHIVLDLYRLDMTYTKDSIRGYEPEDIEIILEFPVNASNWRGEYTWEYLTENLDEVIRSEAHAHCRTYYGTILNEFCVGSMKAYDFEGSRVEHEFNPTYKHVIR